MTLLRQTGLIFIREWWDLKVTIFSFGQFHVGLFPILVFSAALGIYEPYSKGATWVSSPIMVFSFVILIPLVTLSFISPNSIVGERISKTLEPLLATPASDAAILIGKTGLSVIFGWGLSLANMAIGLVAVNVFHFNGELLLYPEGLLLLIIVGSLLFSIFISLGGINFSLYSATLLEAQNKLVIIIFPPLFILGFIIGPLLPKNWVFLRTMIIDQLGKTSNIDGLWVFLIINLLLFLFILYRFNREKLLLGEFYTKS